jgi:hypothetical protein
MIYSGSGPDFLIPSRYGSISSPDPSLKLGKVKKASETNQPKTYQDNLNANMIKKLFFKIQCEYEHLTQPFFSYYLPTPRPTIDSLYKKEVSGHFNRFMGIKNVCHLSETVFA